MPKAERRRGLKGPSPVGRVTAIVMVLRAPGYGREKAGGGLHRWGPVTAIVMVLRTPGWGGLVTGMFVVPQVPPGIKHTPGHGKERRKGAGTLLSTGAEDELSVSCP